MALQQRDEQGRAEDEHAPDGRDPQEVAFGPALRQEHRRVGQLEMLFAQGEQALFRRAGLCELLLDEAPLVLYAGERLFELPGLAVFEGALVLAVDERGQHFVDAFHHILVGQAGDLQLHGPLRGAAHGAGIVDDARVVLHLHHDEHEQPDAEQEDGYDGGDFRSQGHAFRAGMKSAMHGTTTFRAFPGTSRAAAVRLDLRCGRARLRSSRLFRRRGCMPTASARRLR